MDNVLGTTIDDGPADWQIYQQGPSRAADIHVRGRWSCGDDPAWPMVQVQMRLVMEDTGAPVTSHTAWQSMTMRRNGTWSGALKNVPAGGLYRLETRLWDGSAWGGRMGHCRHFLGVGDLWIIGGQSNSAGYGREPAYDPPELGVHAFNNAMRWALATQPANESTDIAHPANWEGYPQHGPWLSWAKAVRRAVGHPIGLIQVSLGGSPLWMWNPTEPQGSSLYDAMLLAVRQAGGKVRGVLWYQGESECGPGNADSHTERFCATVRAWRKALKCPKLHVLTVQLNRVLSEPEATADRCWSLVRESQRIIPTKLPHCSVVPTLDQPLSDGIHNSAHGNLMLGQRAAATALGAAYGRDVDYRAPEPVSAKRRTGGQQIDIRFGNVSGQLTSIDMRPGPEPFVVEDTLGWVPITGMIEFPKKDTVRIPLGRELQGKAVVHGGHGVDPPPVPHDQPRMLPMLAFYRFPVE